MSKRTLSAGDTMSEAALQSAIIELAHALGYICAHFRPALMKIGGTLTYRTPVAADGKGYPDLNLLKAGRVIYIEVKSEKGKQSPEQLRWEEMIRASGAEFYLFRPSDWLSDKVTQVLNSTPVQV